MVVLRLMEEEMERGNVVMVKIEWERWSGKVRFGGWQRGGRVMAGQWRRGEEVGSGGEEWWMVVMWRESRKGRERS